MQTLKKSNKKKIIIKCKCTLALKKSPLKIDKIKKKKTEKLVQ